MNQDIIPQTFSFLFYISYAFLFEAMQRVIGKLTVHQNRKLRNFFNGIRL